MSGAPALRLHGNARPGHLGRDPRLPRERPLHVDARRGSGTTSTVVSQDAYGRGPVRRAITALRGRVRQGNSGGPVVDGSGRVVTTIFAATVSDGGRSGFGVPDSMVADALDRAAWAGGHRPVCALVQRRRRYNSGRACRQDTRRAVLRRGRGRGWPSHRPSRRGQPAAAARSVDDNPCIEALGEGAALPRPGDAPPLRALPDI